MKSTEVWVRGERPMPSGEGGGREEEFRFDFRRYWTLLWRSKFLICFCVLISIGLAAFQLKRTQPAYSTTAVIKFDPQGQQVVDFGERSSFLYQRDEIRTAVELVKSPRVAERVLDALGTKPPAPVSDNSPVARTRRAMRDFFKELRQYFVSYSQPDFDNETIREQTDVQNLLGGLRVNQRGDTKLIGITYTGRDPQQTANIANQFARQFIYYLNDDATQRVGYQREFLNEQVQQAKTALGEAERRLYEYSKTSDLRVMDENLSIAIKTMSALNSEIEGLQIEMSDLESRNRAIREGLVQPTVFSEDPVISSLMKRLIDLRIELLSLEAVNEEQNPDVQRARREIESIESQVKELSSQMAESTSASLLMARYRLEALQARFEDQKNTVDEINGRMIGYSLLKREVDSAELMYKSLLDKFNITEVKDDIQASNVTIVAEAPVPTLPTTPKVTRTLMVFSVFGFFVGVGLAFLISWADRSVKDPGIVEERLGLPTLGFVPYIRRKGLMQRKGGKKAPALINVDAKTSSPEAFHYLRTSLQYSCADRPPQVMLITSCMPQEGKSTVSANLAFFYAQRGGRTIIIDADLKRPAVHKAFDIPRSPGLSDILTRQAELDDVIVTREGVGLDVLPAGANTPSPVNLLDSKAMTELLCELRKRYDTVIIDSAPAHGMADSLVLCRNVDGVCLVVRRGNTHFGVLEQTAAKIRSLNATIFGVIYNSGKERISEKAYGYGSQYYYTYRSNA